MAVDKSKKEKDVNRVLCEVCDKPIPLARLKALPAATMCIKCQQEYEIENPFDGSVYIQEPDADELRDIITPDE
jgi:phage/conjugal plasmid C-4 type zinc finger TraR family protein